MLVGVIVVLCVVIFALSFMRGIRPMEKKQDMSASEAPHEPDRRIVLNDKFPDVCWVVQQMNEMRYAYEAELGRAPLGWIIGFEEYTKLKEAIISQLKKEDVKYFTELQVFQGLPVHIKASKGIELCVDESAGNHFMVRSAQADYKGGLI